MSAKESRKERSLKKTKTSFNLKVKEFTSYTSTTARRIYRFLNLTNEKKFHFDIFMTIPGLWFRRLEEFLPKHSNVNVEKSKSESRNNKKISKFIKWWSAFIFFGIYLPAWLHWTACWFWQSDEAVEWLQDISAILGGSRLYHLPSLCLWSFNNVTVVVQWWFVQFRKESVVVKLVKPLFAVHYPNDARAMG